MEQKNKLIFNSIGLTLILLFLLSSYLLIFLIPFFQIILLIQNFNYVTIALLGGNLFIFLIFFLAIINISRMINIKVNMYNNLNNKNKESHEDFLKALKGEYFSAEEQEENKKEIIPKENYKEVDYKYQMTDKQRKEAVTKKVADMHKEVLKTIEKSGKVFSRDK